MRDRRDLEVLAEELLKEKPNKALVKEIMQKFEIPYSNDPIQQMAAVLNSLDRFSKNGSRKREEEREL